LDEELVFLAGDYLDTEIGTSYSTDRRCRSKPVVRARRTGGDGPDSSLSNGELIRRRSTLALNRIDGKGRVWGQSDDGAVWLKAQLGTSVVRKDLGSGGKRVAKIDIGDRKAVGIPYFDARLVVFEDGLLADYGQHREEKYCQKQ